MDGLQLTAIIILTASLTGMAAFWLFVTVFGSGLLKRWPALVQWMPFLEHDESSVGYSSRVEIAKSKINEQAKRCRAVKTGTEMNIWMDVSRNLVHRTLIESIAREFQAVHSSMAELPISDIDKRHLAESIGVLEIIQVNLIPEHLLHR